MHFCCYNPLTKVHTDISPLVDPVSMLGAEAGITPTLGCKSTLHILALDFNAVISEQKSG